MNTREQSNKMKKDLWWIQVMKKDYGEYKW
jgi:hypothetical protein